jgi:hypothetical protein
MFAWTASPGQSQKSDHLRAVPLAQEKRMPEKWSKMRKEEGGEYGMLLSAHQLMRQP